MILSRDGSIHLRLLMARVAMYGTVVLVAVGVGALIALVGP